MLKIQHEWIQTYSSKFTNMQGEWLRLDLTEEKEYVVSMNEFRKSSKWEKTYSNREYFKQNQCLQYIHQYSVLMRFLLIANWTESVVVAGEWALGCTPKLGLNIPRLWRHSTLQIFSWRHIEFNQVQENWSHAPITGCWRYDEGVDTNLPPDISRWSQA